MNNLIDGQEAVDQLCKKYFPVTDTIPISTKQKRAPVPRQSKDTEQVIASPGVPEIDLVSLKAEADKVIRLATERYGINFVKLHQGDISNYNKDRSKADLGFTGKLARFTEDYNLIEYIWMSSPLGQRSKVLDRPAYRKYTIDKALAGRNYKANNLPKNITGNLSNRSLLFPIF